MLSTDDSALLRQYAENNSDEAFAALVTRHVNLVYSVALRQVSNPHHAEEITQAVFIILARKAAGLRHDRALSSWLFQTTCLTARNFVRSEIRRQHREQEAYMETILNESGNDAWPGIAPLLDSAVAGLNEKDRHAIVLRFYEGRNLREIGMALGANEEAAKKRVSRAVEKLRTFFMKRGVDLPAAVLTATISAHSVQAAPVALAKAVTAIAVGKGAAASGSTLTLIQGALKIMARTKMKTEIIAGIVVLLAAGTTTLVIEKSKVREFSYQGKPLSVWLKDYDNMEEIFANNGSKLHELDKIVNQAGNSAIPTLLQLLKDEDSKGHDFHSNGNEASNGFRVLGASATNAVSSLIEIYEQNPAARVDILYSLNCIGTNADVPVDWLLPKLKDPNHQVRAGITYVLGNMHLKSEQAIPALIECLSDSHRMVRGDSALALGSCGADAKTAIPKLTDLLQDKDKAVRGSAALALKEIDPDVAGKMEVK